MAGNLLTYSGITTKVKSMESRLMREEDYQKISGFESVAEFISFLKSKPAYAHLFESINEQEIHRGKVEEILIYSLYSDFEKIYRFANYNQRAILNLVFFRFEVSILKKLLQGVFNKKTEFNLFLFTEFFNNHSSLNTSSLASSQTIEEFINQLKGTSYYSFFIKLYNDNNNITLFDYEIQLDIYYFRHLWKLKNKYLKGANLEALTHIYGFQIDLLNIIWIYRSKRFYSINTGDIYANLIPINYKLKREEIRKLVESSAIEEFLGVIKGSYYKNIHNVLTAHSLEYLYSSTIKKAYHDNRLKYPATMAPVIDFLFSKEREIDQLTTALECIRYRLEPNEILEYVLT